MEERSTAVRKAICSSNGNTPDRKTANGTGGTIRKNQVTVYVPPPMRKNEGNESNEAQLLVPVLGQNRHDRPEKVEKGQGKSKAKKKSRYSEADAESPETSKKNAPVADIISNVESSDLREKVRKNALAGMNDLSELCSRLSSSSISPSLPVVSQRDVQDVFILDINCGNGKNIEVTVKNTDNPARLAKSLGVKHKYTDVQVRILRKKLENEFEKRNIEIR
ncbi:hypothetical protein WR25_15105 [Diploscapter pachys]|uniref:Uncharacterized protein n=1 Tax=Diploscapter pachys TaxID=2018661 RepID=A0A2A2LLY8_9BILA|nr:hypothetical protein WR25_15105 [Diploscapter pachys]